MARPKSGTLSKQAKRMMLYMKEEYELGNEHNEEEVTRTMEQSFKDRYNFIIYSGPKVVQLKDMYPFLFERKHFFAEFSRITKVDVWKNYNENLDKYAATILLITPWSHFVTDLLQMALKKAVSTEEKHYINRAAAILSLPSLVEEDITDIVKFDSKVSNSVYPCIVCQCSVNDVLMERPTFFIFVEEKKVFETVDFTEAVFLRMASHYCFDIVYPNKFENATALMESLLLEITPDSKDVKLIVKEVHKLITLMENDKDSKQ